MPLSPEALFDVASVTKAAATTLAVAKLVSSEELALDGTLERYLPGELGSPRSTIEELLAHTSGLPAWAPLFDRIRRDPEAGAIFSPDPEPRAKAFSRSVELMRRAVLTTARSEQTGHRVYSDFGFMALGFVLEAVSGESLDGLCHRLIYEPLGLEDIGFCSLVGRRGALSLEGRQVIATGVTRPREPAPGQETLYRVGDQPRRPDPGEVDDDNAYALGGVAGHAGLFATATALAQLGWRLLEELDGADRLGSAEALRRFCQPSPALSGSPRGLGFDFPAREGSACGELLGRGGARGAIGHLGFTGCSLWIDLDRELAVALLTNRTFPGRHHVEALRALRPAVHDALLRSLDLG